MINIRDAAIRGDSTAIQQALKDGIDVDTRDEWQNTALKNTAANNRPNTVKVLLEAGAEIDPQNSYGFTPLHDAAYHNLTDIVKILLAAGADLSLKNRNNNTPTNIARNKGHTKLAEYLQAIADNALPRPTPEEVGLDIHKRITMLETLGKPLGEFTHAERVRKAQRETREAQRQAALRGEGI